MGAWAPKERVTRYCRTSLSARTTAPLNVVFEIRAEQLQGAQDGWAGHVDEGAVAFAAVEVDDLLELVQQRGDGRSLLNAFKRRGQHAGFHAAGWTLTAGFPSEELRDFQRLFDHAGSLRIKAHHAAAERRAGGFQSLGIQVHVKLRAHKARAGRAAGKNSLEARAGFQSAPKVF